MKDRSELKISLASYCMQILGPLVAQGHLDIVDHMLSSLLMLAGTGSAAMLAALLLAAAISGGIDSARDRALLIVKEQRCSLVALALPGRSTAKALRAALRGKGEGAEAAGGVALDAAFPELAALESLRPLVSAAVRGEDGSVDAAVAAVRALPAAARATPELARGIAADALEVALDEEGDGALLARAVPVLVAAGAEVAAGEITTGVRILNAVQVVCAAKENDGIPADSVLVAYKALYGSGNGAVGKGAIDAWLAGVSDAYCASPVAEPVGRESALTVVRDWILAL
jgi:hypothetical protein